MWKELFESAKMFKTHVKEPSSDLGESSTGEQTGNRCYLQKQPGTVLPGFRIIASHHFSMDLVQVLIVNGFIGTAETGVWAPSFYCLMPKKTRAEYSRLYNGLSEVR